ncbi:hypothetical protein [Paenibacillus lautus]|uniref:hypothetical protein n=1 Tax=Paenibacillus lautus TaxID=1401 RepID=UPI001C7DC4C8|nr:hypothetical protein [Paenibacillus lautus]MBX4152388.1 hypothetical protein [Paenibacillus lautus]
MNKVKKWLALNSFELTYNLTHTMNQSGGKSFYNNGTYQVDCYSIKNTRYVIETKTTGRSMFVLLKDGHAVGMRFSQSEFIKLLKTELLILNK